MPNMPNGQNEQKAEKKLNYRSLLLGLALNILVIIVFLLLYHAYFVAPKLEGGTTITPNPIEQQPELNQLP